MRSIQDLNKKLIEIDNKIYILQTILNFNNFRNIISSSKVKLQLHCLLQDRIELFLLIRNINNL